MISIKQEHFTKNATSLTFKKKKKNYEFEYLHLKQTKKYTYNQSLEIKFITRTNPTHYTVNTNNTITVLESYF